MSVSGLKAELKFLESIFDPNHERFRILDWKPDELSCQFNVTGEKLLIIHCNITVRPTPNTHTHTRHHNTRWVRARAVEPVALIITELKRVRVAKQQCSAPCVHTSFTSALLS